jgi:SAM-dependent methyltransferase
MDILKSKQMPIKKFAKNDLKREMISDKLLDILICPVCNTYGLHKIGEDIYCENNNCSKSKDAFYMVNSKPVLINFKKSLVDEEGFRANAGKSIIKRRGSGIIQNLKLLFHGKSKKTINNFSDLKSRMLNITDPKILIVGGGEIGSGLDDFYLNLKDNIIAFDIYESESVSFVADAHFIPIIDNYFDLVIIQAVIEHVLDPCQVVSEISRVLNYNGIVYAETPFMQQVHEGPFDFTRYTESGHRFLFKNFKVVSSGYTSGVGISLIWSLDFFFSGLFRSRYAGKIARLVFFWLRFFDNIIPDKFNIDGACGVYFMGEKSESNLNGSEIIKYYQGNQEIN